MRNLSRSYIQLLALLLLVVVPNVQKKSDISSKIQEEDSGDTYKGDSAKDDKSEDFEHN